MQGTDSWNPEYQIGSQPMVMVDYKAAPIIRYYTKAAGFLRWSKVGRGNQIYTAWIPCLATGKPITYADGDQPGSITIQANGSYFTA